MLVKKDCIVLQISKLLEFVRKLDELIQEILEVSDNA